MIILLFISRQSPLIFDELVDAFTNMFSIGLAILVGNISLVIYAFIKRHMYHILLVMTWFVVTFLIVAWQLWASPHFLGMLSQYLLISLPLSCFDLLIFIPLKLKLVFFCFFQFFSFRGQECLFSFSSIFDLGQTLSNLILNFIVILSLDSQMFCSFIVKRLNHPLWHRIQSFFL